MDANKAISNDFTFEYFPHRGIRKDVLEKYGTSTRIDSDGRPVATGFFYPDGRVKLRAFDKKAFQWEGQKTAEGSLFGQNIFPAASSETITITEGEYDAHAAYQMLGCVFPVVSVQSAQQARKNCSESFDYLNSFKKIVLCLDADNPGKEAARDIARLFDFNKVYQVSFSGHKDANDYLQAGQDKEFRNAWRAAKRFIPEGIVADFAEFDAIIDASTDKPSVPLPFDVLNSKEQGLRTGEVFLVKAMEGVGKTEFLRALEYHYLKTTDWRIGAVHLEESKARQLKGIAGYELKLPAHLPTSGVSNDDIKRAYRKVTDDGQGSSRLHIYNHFGSDDPDILLDSIRFLGGVCGCKLVTFDHITMAVTGLEDDDERRRLDYISTRLAQMANDLDFSLVMVSHINDQGQTRGSRNISKVAHTVLHISRDLTHIDEFERNKMYLNLEKARFTGKTGPAGVLMFNPDTYMLEDLNGELPT